MKSVGLIVLGAIVVSVLNPCDAISCHSLIPPVQLLEPDETKMYLNFTTEGLEFLRDPVRANRPVIPITVVGTAKSGKSFFLGMLTGCREFFPVGHTLKSKTVGVRMFIYEKDDTQSYNHDGFNDNFVTMSNDNDKPLYLLIDTEGLGLSLMLYDKAMLLFSTLASSHMVYHLSQKIEEFEILQLYSIASLVEDLKQKHLVSELDLPNLTWVVDQFTFKDVSSDFKDINLSTQEGALQYLHDYRLKEKPNPTNNKNVGKYNDIVNVVREEFSSHAAFFIHPAVNENNKRNKLDAIEEKDMDPRYLAQIDAVRDLLLQTKPKHLRKDNRDKAMTCNDFADFIESLVPVMKNDTRALVGDLVISLIFQQACEMAISKYNERMSNLSFPLSMSTFIQADRSAQDYSINLFKYLAPKGKFGYIGEQKVLEGELMKESVKYREENYDKSNELCHNISNTVEEKIREIEAKGIHHNELHKALEQIIQNASKEMVGPKKVECISQISKYAKAKEDGMNKSHSGFFSWLGNMLWSIFA